MNTLSIEIDGEKIFEVTDSDWMIVADAVVQSESRKLIQKAADFLDRFFHR